MTNAAGVAKAVAKAQRGSFTEKSLRKWPWIFLAPFCFCFVAFSLYPTLYSFFVSLTNWDALDIANRQYVGLQNYADILFRDSLFWKSLWNTLLLMLIAMPATVILGLVMAQMLFSLGRSRTIFQVVNFLPYITTPVAVGIIFSFIFDWNVGPANALLTQLGLIKEPLNWLGTPILSRFVVSYMIMWKNFGYFMAIFLAGLTTISPDVYEAATVDGANRGQIFFKITLPLLRPVITFVVVSATIGGLQIFDDPKLLFSYVSQNVVGGPGRSVLTAVWYFYDVSFKSTARLGYGSAISFTLFVIICVFAMINLSLTLKREGNP